MHLHQGCFELAVGITIFDSLGLLRSGWRVMLVRVALFAIAVLPFQGHRLNEFTSCFFSGSVP